jgi:hypothetical protein
MRIGRYVLQVVDDRLTPFDTYCDVLGLFLSTTLWRWRFVEIDSESCRVLFNTGFGFLFRVAIWLWLDTPRYDTIKHHELLGLRKECIHV